MVKRKPDVHPYFDKKIREPKLPGYFWTVDPGIGGTGIAEFVDVEVGFPEAPCETTAIVSRRKGWRAKVDGIVSEFKNALCGDVPDCIVFEFQELWSGSSTSMAAGSKGDLFKLTFLTGRLAQVAYDAGCEVVLVKPGEWKGQLSKKAVDRRIDRAFGLAFGNHVSDAVGMGLAMQRVL